MQEKKEARIPVQPRKEKEKCPWDVRKRQWEKVRVREALRRKASFFFADAQLFFKKNMHAQKNQRMLRQKTAAKGGSSAR